MAVALPPGASVDEVVDVMTRYCGYELRRLVAMAGDLVDDSAAVDDFAERFYATMLDTSPPVPMGQMWDKQRSVSPSSRAVLPVVLAILRLCDGDVDRCLIEAASFGRDADTIASVIGGA